jgi:hypothetical protein
MKLPTFRTLACCCFGFSIGILAGAFFWKTRMTTRCIFGLLFEVLGIFYVLAHERGLK